MGKDEELSKRIERCRKESGKAESGLTPDLEEELDNAIKEVSKVQRRESDEETEAGYDEIKGFKKDLLSLRLGASSAHVKDYSQFRKLRKSIARAQTYLSQVSRGKK